MTRPATSKQPQFSLMLAQHGPPVFTRGMSETYQATGRRRAEYTRPKTHVESASQALADDDLLERVLVSVVPECVARRIARGLLDELGDFGRVIAASNSRLRRVAGVSDAVIRQIRMIEACAQRIARCRVIDRPLLSSWQAVLDYCHTVMSHRETEQFRVLFLDRKNVLIADEVLGEGTVDHVPVYPREVLRRALELNVSALILVHNHPSGDPTPSDSDVTMTRTIQSAAEALAITLHDHIIIGKSCETSFRSCGLL